MVMLDSACGLVYSLPSLKLKVRVSRLPLLKPGVVQFHLDHLALVIDIVRCTSKLSTAVVHGL